MYSFRDKKDIRVLRKNLPIIYHFTHLPLYKKFSAIYNIFVDSVGICSAAPETRRVSNRDMHALPAEKMKI